MLSDLAYCFLSGGDVEQKEQERYIYVKLKNYSYVYDYSLKFASEEFLFYNNELLSVLGISGSGESVKQIVYILAVFLIIIIVMATIILIGNAFYISVNQRIKQYV